MRETHTIIRKKCFLGGEADIGEDNIKNGS
jgi:hypothetical protein